MSLDWERHRMLSVCRERAPVEIGSSKLGRTALSSDIPLTGIRGELPSACRLHKVLPLTSQLRGQNVNMRCLPEVVCHNSGMHTNWYMIAVEYANYGL